VEKLVSSALAAFLNQCSIFSIFAAVMWFGRCRRWHRDGGLDGEVDR
jgi:hypothetical protein